MALAAHLPYPDWAAVGFDDLDPVKALRASAPGSRMVARGPGWHRLRTPDDIRLLDPGLEGWDNTRALLLVLTSPKPSGRRRQAQVGEDRPVVGAGHGVHADRVHAHPPVHHDVVDRDQRRGCAC